jgi:hypothetical protein
VCHLVRGPHVISDKVILAVFIEELRKFILFNKLPLNGHYHYDKANSHANDSQVPV